MKSFLIHPDLETYMPSKFNTEQRGKIITLISGIQEAVDLQMPIGFSQDGYSRLVLPHSIFLQMATPHMTGDIVLPGHIKTRMRHYKKGARRTIGMDAYQVLSKREETAPQTKKESRNGWKTFHLDKIDDLKLMETREIRDVFQLKNDAIDEYIHLTRGFATIEDFVKNWNHWFRTFITQVKKSDKNLIIESGE